jgi:hypothetical protein
MNLSKIGNVYINIHSPQIFTLILATAKFAEVLEHAYLSVRLNPKS